MALENPMVLEGMEAALQALSARAAQQST